MKRKSMLHHIFCLSRVERYETAFSVSVSLQPGSRKKACNVIFLGQLRTSNYVHIKCFHFLPLISEETEK